MCVKFHLMLHSVHPFFTKPSASSSTVSSFQWLKPALGPKRTCLHGINLIPKSTPKVAAFDLDGTVIKSNHKNRSKEAALHWEWWRASVPVKLEELHQKGYVQSMPSQVTTQSSQILNYIDIQSSIKATAFGGLEKEDSPHLRCCKSCCLLF